MGGLIIKVGLFLQKSGIQTGKCGYESAAERITLSNYGILYDSYIKNGRTL
jgi:archaellin